jgi:iron complex transport system substrate-binding protein
VKSHRLKVTLVAVATVALLGGGTATAAQLHGQAPAVEVAAAVGGHQTKPQHASKMRIVSLVPSHTEILYALGMENQLVGWTQYDDYPPAVTKSQGWVPYDKYQFVSVEDELAKQRAVVGSFTQFNFDVIAALKPTLILAAEPLQKKIAEELAAKGYNVKWWSPTTLDDVHQMIIEIGQATGTEAAAKKLVSSQQKEINKIKAVTRTLPKARVYFEIGHFGPWALGSGSPMDQIIDIAGGQNIFNDRNSIAFPADNADIAARNPDIILSPLWPAAGRGEVTTIFEISSRPGYSETNAVRNDRVYHYDSSMLKRPGPRQVTAILKLAHLLHPYYFDNPKDSVSPWELGKIDEFYPPPAPLK